MGPGNLFDFQGVIINIYISDFNIAFDRIESISMIISENVSSSMNEVSLNGCTSEKVSINIDCNKSISSEMHFIINLCGDIPDIDSWIKAFVNASHFNYIWRCTA